MSDHDPIDHAIAALVALRDDGLSLDVARQLVADVYAAPWDEKPRTRPGHTDPWGDLLAKRRAS